ncbi:hypothetical protein DM01DRAFT_1029969 [Hesseltinella vesiculosa]|uniref:Uncharacterized protein n=1 Tax=Hesseltinella vesiculosa TaxID=101127 RepID=A0A1X2GJ64_9FUNG|nr:hypothetical protein DM01DRAFT_1029969 [Hesseltinella vesiculosa]
MKIIGRSCASPYLFLIFCVTVVLSATLLSRNRYSLPRSAWVNTKITLSQTPFSSLPKMDCRISKVLKSWSWLDVNRKEK